MNHELPDWQSFALLLIDVQQDFWTRRAPHFPDFPANVANLLSFCRWQRIEVVHLRAAFQPDRTDWMVRYRLGRRIPCIQGTPGADPLACALEQPGEEVFIKQSFDGFMNPDLNPYLRLRKKRFLLTAGLVTSICVLFTAVSAMQNGFLTALVEDCCADDPSAHIQTLEHYSFIFERTTLNQLADRRLAWLEQIIRVDAPQVERLPAGRG